MGVTISGSTRATCYESEEECYSDGSKLTKYGSTELILDQSRGVTLGQRALQRNDFVVQQQDRSAEQDGHREWAYV